MNSALGRLSEKLAPQRAVDAPECKSFRDFLEHHARVRVQSGPLAGTYAPYSFAGREALEEVVNVIDHALGSLTGQPLKDTSIGLAGGAQFGKSTLELNLAAYATALPFLNPIVFLPDDKLAEEIVDAKFRPDVVDQVEWFARMTQVGRAVNKSGKAVNTKGAFLVTDGQRKSVGMFRGLQKPPTTFTADLVIEDEKDDIPRAMAKYASGRMTASALRLHIVIGTQRVHGAGMNAVWKAGSQGVALIGPAGAIRPEARREFGHDFVTAIPAGYVDPVEAWPRICRCAVTGTPRRDDPTLGWEGDFRRGDEVAATYTPDGHYYYAHPETGEPLDAHRPLWCHLRPERIAARKLTFRVAQIGTAAIDLAQIVAHWTRAVGDAEEMTSFCCDRLAKPKSAAQALTPEILERARKADPFFAGEKREATVRFAGLDMGDRCWYFAREVAGPADKRCLRAAQIALGDVVTRVRSYFEADGLATLCIDERPAVSEARTLALVLNGLDQLGQNWPSVDWNSREAYIALPGGLTWDGRNRRWLNLRCAVVRFSKKQLGDGLEQGAAEFDEQGVRKFVPLIACNRFETIDRVVREFLTPAENVIEVTRGADGKNVIREAPAMRLPRRDAGAPGLLETLDAHLLAGSQREKDARTGELGDYVDGVDNHLIFADGYSALAEAVGGRASGEARAYERVAASGRAHERIERGRGVLV